MNFAGYGECPIQETVRVSSLFTFFRKTYSLDFTFQGESHDFYEVVCVLDGKAGITAGKNVYTLSAGQMILHPPAEFHCGEVSRNTRQNLRAHARTNRGDKVGVFCGGAGVCFG